MIASYGTLALCSFKKTNVQYLVKRYFETNNLYSMLKEVHIILLQNMRFVSSILKWFIILFYQYKIFQIYVYIVYKVLIKTCADTIRIKIMWIMNYELWIYERWICLVVISTYLFIKTFNKLMWNIVYNVLSKLVCIRYELGL